jgi:uncharacterized protein (TIGR03086 family)
MAWEAGQWVRVRFELSEAMGVVNVRAGRAGTGKVAARLVVVIVVVVVVFRVGVVLAVTAADPHRGDSGDKSSYVLPAEALLHDHQFDHEPGSDVAEFVRTPGYPAFLAAVYGVSGESDTAVYVVQALLSGLAVLLAIDLARRLSGSLVVGLVAGVALALDPLQTAVQGFVGTEALATVLVMTVAWCGVRFVQSGLRPRWGLAYGGALVVATYVRPTTFYFCAVPAVLLLPRLLKALRSGDRRRVKAVVAGGAALVVPCVVLLGVWNERNHREVGSWRFSAIESVNLYWYRGAGVVSERDRLGFQEARVQVTEELSQGQVPPFPYGDYASGQLPPGWEDRQGEYYGEAQRRGTDLLLAEPAITLRQMADGVYSQFVQSGWVVSFSYLTGDAPPAPVQALGLAAVWTVEAAAVLGMVVALRRRGPLLLAHLMTLALIGTTIFAGAGPEAADGARFRIPVWPLWCAYAAIGAATLVEWWRGQRSPDEEIDDTDDATDDWWPFPASYDVEASDELVGRTVDMSEYSERYRKVAAAFTARVEAVPPGAWDNPAPVEGWVARDVVRHLTEWIPALFFSAWDVEQVAGPDVDDDPAGAWKAFDTLVQSILDDPAQAEVVGTTPMGEASFEQTFDQIATNDVFMHTWDLARATGLDETLDPDEVHQLLVGMEPLDEMLRQSGHYGPRVPVPDDADEQTKLIAFIGRQPSPRPASP